MYAAIWIALIILAWFVVGLILCCLTPHVGEDWYGSEWEE